MARDVEVDGAAWRAMPPAVESASATVARAIEIRMFIGRIIRRWHAGRVAGTEALDRNVSFRTGLSLILF
jgi:hypothetical protein